MTATAPEPLRVIGGVDTHADTIHVALIDALGRALDDREFPTTPAGYQAALEFLISFGEAADGRHRGHQLLRDRADPCSPGRRDRGP